jgi:hypothetical protein
MALKKISEGSRERAPLHVGYAFEEVTFQDGGLWLCAAARRFRNHWNEPNASKVLLHKLIPLCEHEMGLRTGRFHLYVPTTLTFAANTVDVDEVRFRRQFDWVIDNVTEAWSWELLYHTAPWTTQYARYGVRYWFEDRDTALTFRLTWN